MALHEHLRSLCALSADETAPSSADGHRGYRAMHLLHRADRGSQPDRRCRSDQQNPLPAAGLLIFSSVFSSLLCSRRGTILCRILIMPIFVLCERRSGPMDRSFQHQESGLVRPRKCGWSGSVRTLGPDNDGRIPLMHYREPTLCTMAGNKYRRESFLVVRHSSI
jgi:hypothetical protein